MTYFFFILTETLLPTSNARTLSPTLAVSPHASSHSHPHWQSILQNSFVLWIMVLTTSPGTMNVFLLIVWLKRRFFTAPTHPTSSVFITAAPMPMHLTASRLPVVFHVSHARLAFVPPV